MLNPLSHISQGKNGILKEKVGGLWGNEGGVSLLFLWAVASRFQDVSGDNGSGTGLAIMADHRCLMERDGSFH